MGVLSSIGNFFGKVASVGVKTTTWITGKAVGLVNKEAGAKIENWGSAVYEKAGDLGSAVGNKAEDWMSKIGELLTNIFGPIVSFFKGVINFFTKVWRFIYDLIKKIVTWRGLIGFVLVAVLFLVANARVKRMASAWSAR